MNRLTRNQDKFWGKDNYVGHKYIIGADGVTSKQMVIDKLGRIEDLMEKYHIRDVEHLEKTLEAFEFSKLGKIFPNYVQQLDKESE